MVRTKQPAKKEVPKTKIITRQAKTVLTNPIKNEVLNGKKKKNTTPKLQNHGGIKRPHRFKPGTVALRDIRKFVQGTQDLIPEAPFQRLVRSIASESSYNKSLINSSFTSTETDDGKDVNLIRFGGDSIAALKSAAQDYLIQLFKKSNRAAMHARRTTIYPKDMRLWYETEYNRINFTDFPETIVKPKKRTVKNNTKTKTKKNKKENENETKMDEDKSTKDLQNNDINNNDININIRGFI